MPVLQPNPGWAAFPEREAVKKPFILPGPFGPGWRPSLLGPWASLQGQLAGRLASLESQAQRPPCRSLYGQFALHEALWETEDLHSRSSKVSTQSSRRAAPGPKLLKKKNESPTFYHLEILYGNPGFWLLFGRGRQQGLWPHWAGIPG